MIHLTKYLLLWSCLCLMLTEAFVPPGSFLVRKTILAPEECTLVLHEKKRKKKRRRKQTSAPTKPAASTSQPTSMEPVLKQSVSTQQPKASIQPVTTQSTPPIEPVSTQSETEPKPTQSTSTEVASTQLESTSTTTESQIIEAADPIATEQSEPFISPNTALETLASATKGATKSPPAGQLPNLVKENEKQAIMEEIERLEKKELAARPKLRRDDRESLQKLYSGSPLADEDESLFEDDYDVVSALLGERSASFLGIPPGPLQVGHFIGSLGIILCAFVEYPGFPLTNLPTPLRQCLQDGLGLVYLINTILAVIAASVAPGRDQPVPLWAIKTFAVGGLALDQLTQLPTKEELAKAKAENERRKKKMKKREEKRKKKQQEARERRNKRL